MGVGVWVGVVGCYSSPPPSPSGRPPKRAQIHNPVPVLPLIICKKCIASARPLSIKLLVSDIIFNSRANALSDRKDQGQLYPVYPGYVLFLFCSILFYHALQ